MSTNPIRRTTVTVLGLAALLLATAPAPAAARDTAPILSSPAIRFELAVSDCAQRAPRQTNTQVRTCVHGLTTPDPADAEIFDLWRIFTNCLSLMAESGPDAMYPSSHYEDLVNDCLGL
nr:hypothetical protein [Micromonospora sp. DSM 115978]